jgi:hypothetical protein
MGTLTPNYSFYMPDGNEFVDEDRDLNDNWTKADTQIKAVADSIKTILIARKTADETVTNSTTLQADDHLFVPVAANSVYLLDAFLMYSGPVDPAGGIKFDWTGPAGFTLDWAAFGTLGVGVGTLVDYDVVKQAATGTRNHGTNGATIMSLQPKGTLVTLGTSGTVTLRWAQAAANATGTILRTNSTLRLMKA